MRLAGGVCWRSPAAGKRISGIATSPGDHPLPNQDSFASSLQSRDLLRETSARDFVFFLISGGGSAMFELPLDPDISLEDTRIPLSSPGRFRGTIAEINACRNSFSAVKGGRSPRPAPTRRESFRCWFRLAPAFLDALASGPTLPDPHGMRNAAILSAITSRTLHPSTAEPSFGSPTAETPQLPPGRSNAAIRDQQISARGQATRKPGL